MQKFAELDWSIVPGPPELPSEIFPSDHVDNHVALYEPDLVASVFLQLEPVSMIQSGDGDWWKWTAAYKGHSDQFELNMTLFEIEPPCWGGSDLIGVTEPNEALRFWHEVQKQLPFTYLHSSDAQLHSFEGFVGRFLRK